MFYLFYSSKCNSLKPISLPQAVSTAKGQALADEYGIKFFETVSNSFRDLLGLYSDNAEPKYVEIIEIKYHVFQSAKTDLNVEQVFFSIARDIKQRLAETDSKAEVQIFSL